MVPSNCSEWTTVSTPSTVLWRLTHFMPVPKTLPHTSPMHRRSMVSPRTSGNRTCCGVRPACASSNLRICVVSEYVQLDALVVTVCMYVQPVHGAHHRRRVNTDERATSSLIRSQSESPAGAAARCPRCVEDLIASATSREAEVRSSTRRSSMPPRACSPSL